ncbi:MAG: exo-alpha-sialidase, partial [bacterium]|nr:exo-alpha-sialidase [bacterium]
MEEHRLGGDAGHAKSVGVIDGVDDTVAAGGDIYTDASLVMGVARSTDGGHTWTSDLITGHSAMSDPVIKAGRNGLWYYAYIARGGGGGNDFDVYVRRSGDSGASWGAPTNVTNDGNFDDKPFMDAAGNDVVIGYADFGTSPSKVHAVRSVDGALTFTHDTTVSINSGSGNGAHPIIGPDGSWHIFWRDSYQDSLWVAHSSDRGQSWSPDRGIVDMHPLPSSMPPGFRIVNLPVADANPVTATLLVVWNDQRFGNPDILCIRSVDGGTTWSAPIRVNDDP